jgi:hypothetical protein
MVDIKEILGRTRITDDQLLIYCLLSRSEQKWWTNKELLEKLPLSGPVLRTIIKAYLDFGLLEDSGTWPRRCRWKEEMPEDLKPFAVRHEHALQTLKASDSPIRREKEVLS